ncbi:hypothetical protein [Winogradskyella alexanderae]|uniref:Uncharacterized protein n=1 Tax=Winogradskyella alexanderae TaxID=2877123 RepID=A0ABS7XWC4_9FLAO|nr:hypothetical protein [Winogradskyella alexanderae]MCA0133704.1 hypothetical protein [Winogradskyella alexanderae]
MVLTIIFIILLTLVLYLLFVPILLVIDTRTNNYSVRLKGLISASVLADDQEVFKIQMRILGFELYLHPLKTKRPKATKKTSSVEKKPSKNRFQFKTIVRLIRTFKIKQFYLNLDTGDCIGNAKLYPAFAFLNFYIGGFHINFTGQNTLVLVVENKPIRLIRSYINI